MIVNGRRILSRPVKAGDLSLRLPLPATSLPRRIELDWRVAPLLPQPDGRPAPALLKFLGLVSH